MWKSKAIITILVVAILLPTALTHAGVILSTHKYAWSNNVGYINFENVIVNDGALSGYAWSENTGWIKFNPSKGGVFNDGNGHLSGFAWGEGLGWINFSGVNVSTTSGRFSGSATGETVGTINFDCPSYCDVRTDWTVVPVTPPVTPTTTPIVTPTTTPIVTPTTTPIVTPPVITSSSHSGSYLRSFFGFGVPSHVDGDGSFLSISPEQSGTLRTQTSVGLVSLDVPANDLYGRTTFVVREQIRNAGNGFLVLGNTNLINDAFFDVYALDQNGLYVRYFDRPLTISLPVSALDTDRGDLGLYWLNETNWKWVLIPDAIFADGKVTFGVTQLAKFAIFGMQNGGGEDGEVRPPATLSTKPPASLTLPAGQKSTYTEAEKVQVAADQVDLSESTSTAVSQPSSGLFAIIFLGLATVVVVVYFVKRKR